MGTVYRVEHVALGRSYALKVLRSAIFERDPPQRRAVLARGAGRGTRIQHPHIVDVFDFGYLADGRPYFVMELLAGESLGGSGRRARAVATARRLDDREASSRDALATAHEARRRPCRRHAVERADHQRRPLHVKLDRFRPRARSAAKRSTSSRATSCSARRATSRRSSCAAWPRRDRSDQYGLGAVLFELITGGRRTPQGSARAVHDAHPGADSARREPARTVAREARRDVIARACRSRRRQRFPGMRAMLAALDEIDRVADQRDWRVAGMRKSSDGRASTTTSRW